MATTPELDVPWTRTPLAARVREGLVCGVLGVAMDCYTRRSLHGRERLRGLEGPVVFVANHNSHMDTPALIRALPGPWRRRTAVAAAVDYFYGSRLNALSASLVFGTVPLDRSGGGLGPEHIAHIDAHLEGAGNLLVYAEGSRSHDGRMGRLRSGAAVIAARHGAPVVPIYVGGTGDAMPRGNHWMVFRGGRPGRGRHPIEIRFGQPIHPEEGLDGAAVMARVASFFTEHGAEVRPGSGSGAAPDDGADAPADAPERAGTARTTAEAEAGEPRAADAHVGEPDTDPDPDAAAARAESAEPATRRT